MILCGKIRINKKKLNLKKNGMKISKVNLILIIKSNIIMEINWNKTIIVQLKAVEN